MGPPAKITRREGRTGTLLLTSSGLGYPRRLGCSPPPPQLRTLSLSPLTFTSAERGVAEVRGEPADQPGCPKEQPGHSAGSQDAGARRPRGALGASCGHGRNLSTTSVRSPSPVTRTERRKHFHPRITLQIQVPERPVPWPRPSSSRPGRGEGLRKRKPSALCCLGNDPRGGAQAGLGTGRAALGPHSPRSAPLPVHNRMRAGWAPCL